MLTKDINGISRITPIKCNAPVGKYSHITFIPHDKNIYTFSGQIGINEKGVISNNFNEQVKWTFKNIKALLESQQLEFKDIIKVNIWSTKEIDWEYFDTLWDSSFMNSYPSMTIAYISALGLAEIDIEIEIWAAK
ncbi:RidA family protein [Myroides injenensis]|uniref:RidA family protein n=1 Tax=Myroides injenensis TaxID=1183151 RepID=UPI000288ECAA|nr:RidA family protein [Myroides injenensis]